MGFLAIDVGGTKTEIGFFERVEEIKFIQQKRYQSKNYDSLEEIIDEFIKENDLKIEKMGIGIAGPVVEGICHTTNLPWIVDRHKIINYFRLKDCFLVNDLVANAYGIELLNSENLIVVQKGIQKLKGNKALISPGTGLGEAGIFFDGNNYHPFPTEGGHCDFAPTSDEEIELLKFLKSEFSHVSYERILSGDGFVNLYNFYTKVMAFPRILDIDNQPSKREKAKLITELAIKDSNITCKKSLEAFLRILAAEASNLALKMYAISGIYVGGGIIPKILPSLKISSFLSSFKDKGRFQEWMNFIPIYLINDEKTALKGAALLIKK